MDGKATVRGPSPASSASACGSRARAGCRARCARPSPPRRRWSRSTTRSSRRRSRARATSSSSGRTRTRRRAPSASTARPSARPWDSDRRRPRPRGPADRLHRPQGGRARVDGGPLHSLAGGQRRRGLRLHQLDGDARGRRDVRQPHLDQLDRGGPRSARLGRQQGLLRRRLSGRRAGEACGGGRSRRAGSSPSATSTRTRFLSA